MLSTSIVLEGCSSLELLESSLRERPRRRLDGDGDGYKSWRWTRFEQTGFGELMWMRFRRFTSSCGGCDALLLF